MRDGPGESHLTFNQETETWSGIPRSGVAERWLVLALSAGVLGAEAFATFRRGQAVDAALVARSWAPIAGAAIAAAGVVRSATARRGRRALLWSAAAIMIWVANGLPFDLLRLTPLIPLPADRSALVTKVIALSAAIVLVHLAMAPALDARAHRPATWYGYAAFVFALPYPVLRICWAFGATPGLLWPGAAGHGWAPWLLTIPWLLAAGLSLLLVRTWRRLPRRLLLTAGWSATAIVGLVGPGASWKFFSAWAAGGPRYSGGIALWVFGLFYVSWLLWAIAAGAATRSYQVRSASPSRLAASATLG